MTGGQYFRARNQEELDKIYDTINQLQPVTNADQTWRPLKTEWLTLSISACIGTVFHPCNTKETTWLIFNFFTLIGFMPQIPALILCGWLYSKPQRTSLIASHLTQQLGLDKRQSHRLS